VAVYDSLGVSGRSGWFQIGGTSAGAPQWAALVAIVDQGRALSGQPLLGDGHAALYNLASTDFHDVTAGSNGNRATTGYDLVTGRGTPVANAIVRDLVATSSSSTSPSGPIAKPAPAPMTTPTYRYELVYSNHRWYIVRVVANAIAADDVDSSINRVVTSLATVSAGTPVAVVRDASQGAIRDERLSRPLPTAEPSAGPYTNPRRAGGKLAPRGGDEGASSEALPGEQTKSGGAVEGVPAPSKIDGEAPDGDEQPQSEFLDEAQSVPQDATWSEYGLAAGDMPSENLNGLPDSAGEPISRQWEAELAVLSIAVAAAMYGEHRHPSGVEPRIASRRQFWRLVRD
jgi:hypothetical protein